MKKSYRKKKLSERIHFRRAMINRYGVDLTTDQCLEIIRAIRQRGRTAVIARLLERKSHTRSLYEIIINEQSIMIIYDNMRHELITALPPHNAEEWKKRRQDEYTNRKTI